MSIQVWAPTEVYLGAGHRYCLPKVLKYSDTDNSKVPATGLTILAWQVAERPTEETWAVGAHESLRLTDTTKTLAPFTAPASAHGYHATVNETEQDAAMAGLSSVWECYDGPNIRVIRRLVVVRP